MRELQWSPNEVQFSFVQKKRPVVCRNSSSPCASMMTADMPRSSHSREPRSIVRCRASKLHAGGAYRTSCLFHWLEDQLTPGAGAPAAFHVQKLSHRLASTVFGMGWDEVVWNGMVWGGLGWERTGFGCSLLTSTVFGWDGTVWSTVDSKQ